MRNKQIVFIRKNPTGARFSDIGNIDTNIPFLCLPLWPKTKYDWNYTTKTQDKLGDRVIDYPQGYILGGSSTISELKFISLSL